MTKEKEAVSKVNSRQPLSLWIRTRSGVDVSVLAATKRSGVRSEGGRIGIVVRTGTMVTGWTYEGQEKGQEYTVRHFSKI